MGRITTHILDTARGRPAQGVKIELFAVPASGEAPPRCLAATETNADGRTDQPLLAGEALAAGTYELVFHMGPYFAREGEGGGAPPFLDRIAIRFGVADAGQHYHVPLLVSPFAYSTYRGS